MKIHYAIAACIIAPMTLCGSAIADVPVSNSYQLQTADLPPLSGSETGGAASADGSSAGEDEQASNPQCATFEKDPDADMGEVIRAGCEPTLAQMARLMDNPLGSMAALFTQIDYYQLKEPKTGKRADKANYMGIAQFPTSIGENWNLINRVIWNVPSTPLDQGKIDQLDNLDGAFGDLQGVIGPPRRSFGSAGDLISGRTTGFGDMYYLGLFSPKQGIKHDNGGTSVWGIGFDLMAPTASEDILGTGKWGAGPAAVYAYLGPKWKLGALAQQYWDFAGDSDRSDINLTNLQYFWFYSLDETTSIGAAPNIIANWGQSSGNVWNVPIGLGINKTVKLGKVPVRFGIEAYYSVIKPNDVLGYDWSYRFYMIPAVPAALFSWMQ